MTLPLRPASSAPAASPPPPLLPSPLRQLLAFQRYRDLIRLLGRGLTDEQGLEAAAAENIELRAAARAAAAAHVTTLYGLGRPAGGTSVAAPAGHGVYSTVGFSYGGVTEEAAAAELASSSEEEEEGAAGFDNDDDGLEEGEDQRLDEVGEQYGVYDFCYRLSKAMEQEGEEDAQRIRRPR